MSSGLTPGTKKAGEISTLDFLQESRQNITHIRSALYVLHKRVSSVNDEIIARLRQLITQYKSILQSLQHHRQSRRQSLLNLPHIDCLDDVLQTIYDLSSIEAIRTVNRMISPLGQFYRILSETLDVIEEATFHQQLNFKDASSLSIDKSNRLQQVQREVVRLLRLRASAKQTQRNVRWKGIPFRLLRTHAAFIPAPIAENISITKAEKISLIRRDAEAFTIIRNTIPLSAHSLSAVFGLLGDDDPSVGTGSRLRDGKTRRKIAVSAWNDISRRLRSVKRGQMHQQMTKPSFDDLFTVHHVANATISYIDIERARWHQESDASIPQWSEAVQVREPGLQLGQMGGLPCVATPAGIVARRKAADFWMWGSEDTIILVNIEHPFQYPNPDICHFHLPQVRQHLTVVDWMRAQFSLACCGDRMVLADVIRYSSYGGICIFRVERDDDFLTAAEEYLKVFIDRFVRQGVPPSSTFWEELNGEAILSMALSACANAKKLSHIASDMCEMGLQLIRNRMSEWEEEHAEECFLGRQRQHD